MTRMHLTPREHERLLLSSGADLARRRLARGARLGAADAVALVCDEICELAWDDLPLEQVVERARELVPPDALLPGVASAVPQVQVEALFPHGTVLVHVAHPFGRPEADGPGGVRTATEPIELAPGRRHALATLHNTGTQAIWVSSHIPLGQLNHALTVSLADPDGFRLDVPAGVAVRVGPGERRDVEVVAVERAEGGRR
jgi:urease subunit gamma/beta